ncbi:MAG: redoxin domain-containing protein [Deltaproteobacteria bacterium]|nr:redoxin domain-containing protein [Deltaproteobacteria bacterium]
MKIPFAFTTIVIFALLSFLVSHASALEIGDDAPEIAIDKWINGGPVKIKEGNGQKIYIVEFWATWCPPCRKSIPHLSKLQTKFKESGVDIVGISNESIEAVEKFAGTAGFTYNVGVDKDNQTTSLYREGEQGIPHAFVIGKDGKIAWYGHPMDEMDIVIEQIISGKYDRKKAAKLCALKKRMSNAISSNDKNNLINIANKIIEINPGDQQAFGILSQIYVIEEDPISYKKLCRKLVNSETKSSEMLSIVAEAMLTNNDPRFRDIEIALNAAESSNQIDGNTQTLELLSQIFFELGHIDKAITHLKKALSMADDEYEQVGLENMLGYYTSVLKLSKSLTRKD